MWKLKRKYLIYKKRRRFKLRGGIRRVNSFWRRSSIYYGNVSTKKYLKNLHGKFFKYLEKIKLQILSGNYLDLNGKIKNIFYKKYDGLRFRNLDWFRRLSRFNTFGLKSAIVDFDEVDVDSKKFYFPKKLYSKLERRWHVFFKRYVSNARGVRFLRKYKTFYVLLKRKWRLKWYFKKKFF